MTRGTVVSDTSLRVRHKSIHTQPLHSYFHPNPTTHPQTHLLLALAILQSCGQGVRFSLLVLGGLPHHVPDAVPHGLDGVVRQCARVCVRRKWAGCVCEDDAEEERSKANAIWL